MEDLYQKHKFKSIVLFCFFVVIVVLDQYTKSLAVRHLKLGESINIIPGIFDLTLVYNPGAAFGMFAQLPDPYRQIVLGGFSFIALFLVWNFFVNEAREDLVAQYCLIGIIAGALGNIIDRARFGKVVDFFDFYWKDSHWPAFNVADSAICIAVTVLLIKMLFFSKKPS